MSENFKMPIRDGFVEAIGNTPLVRLRKASEETGCTILGKAEFMNPGGSVKDRAALGLVRWHVWAAVPEHGHIGRVVGAGALEGDQPHPRSVELL